MDKVLLILLLATVYITVKTKPPVVINSLEAIVLKVRDIGLYFTHPKYFHNDTDDYKAIEFEKVLKETSTKLDKKNDSWILTTSYQSESRPTTILLVNGFYSNKPSLIYHHGAGSTSPLKDFNFIFGKEYKEKFNIFIVWAQYHHSKKEYLEKSVDSFLHHQETFAGSVLAYEEIVKHHKSQSSKPIVATGSSMGGIASSLHAFYFGSADYYFPIVAYPNVGEIFLGRAYKYAVNDIEQKRQNESYLTSFEIKDFDKNLTKKVFPILGTKDKVVPSEKAIQFWEDKGFEVTKYPYGHFTPGVMSKDIRKLILEKIEA